MSKDIDFATIHLWPNNWQAYDSTFINNWLEGHSQVASQLGKPLILEEVRPHHCASLRAANVDTFAEGHAGNFHEISLLMT